MSAALARLLSGFNSVRKVGPNRWRCQRHGSGGHNVAVALTSDGRILLKDYANHTAAEVLAELGMTLADLAPERPELARYQSPQERREARRALALASVECAAQVLDTHASVIQAAATMLSEGQRLDAEDHAALSAAHDAIVAARMILRSEVRS